MKYKKRVTDTLLKNKLETFGGVLIVGPKGCGKTTSAKQYANSFIEFQNEEEREQLLITSNINPTKLLEGAKPRLFDEWQDAPKIWGTIRKSIDDEQKTGLYILTGSTSSQVDVAHSGTLRITTLKMYPLSLYETNESNGSVSLIDLFNKHNNFNGATSDLSFDDLVFAICRGGWPICFNIAKKENQLAVATDLVYQICNKDISNIDKVKRKSDLTLTILKSYARNICTLTELKTIYKDVSANYEISDNTFYDYLDALKRLYIVEDIDAWSPAIRPKTVIRSSKKRNFICPSIAAASLGLSPESLHKDYKTLGFLFESLCIRDLKIYSSKLNGHFSYYRDRYQLEADGVLHLRDGRFALIEFKLGQNEIDKGAKHLLKIEELIKKFNEKDKQIQLRLPDLKIIITATKYGYKRDDGVLVVPIGCLKD